MTPSLPRVLASVLLFAFIPSPPVAAQETEAADAPAEALQAIEGFQVPKGAKVTLWAAEPLLQNPVAFDVDHRGRVFVAETYRQETEGVPDNRAHRYWIEDDLRLRTVEERGAMYLKHHPEYAEQWTQHTDRIVRVVDADGDGRADGSTVFATDFRDLLDGTGAGVLVRGSEAWYTCIPKLWKLVDADDDGVSETREALHHGYGVRVALRGHDLHGLVVGPDGRLYFSVGDRGYTITTQEGNVLSDPGAGAVFRCELDGSELEVFATGLRNPQELAFDEYGNLFTGDNNCDAGDAARLVYVMEGGDSGWSMNFQYLPDRGPWMSEDWWKPAFEGQAAFLNAPIANLAAGPSGLAYYPGVGMPEAYQGSFFLVDFRGGASHSGVHRFTVKPDGAGFALDQSERFWWGVLATDVAFAPDGSLFLSDWVATWTGAGKGRLYRMAFDAPEQATEVAGTRKLLAEGMQGRSVAELIDLLHKRDYRVRLEAQWRLMEIGEPAVAPLAQLALKQGQPRARRHAVWALARLGQAEPLIALLASDSEDLRAQAARGLAECRDVPVAALIPLLEDPSPRVVYHAAQSLGALGDPVAINPLLELLRRNQDRDRFVRHAASYALAHLADAATLARTTQDPSKSAALGSVLALRHQGDPALAAFVAHEDWQVATEAAIAIYDRNVHEAFPALVERLVAQQSDCPDALARRALHAANRIGRLAPIVAYAADPANPETLRLEASDMIAHWLKPQEFDALRNESRHFPPRAKTPAVGTFLEQTTGAAPELRTALARLASGVAAGGSDSIEPMLFALVESAEEAEATRIAALEGLQACSSQLLEPALDVAWNSGQSKLRALADRLWRKVRPSSLPDMQRLLAAGSGEEQAQWFPLFAEPGSKEADAALVLALEALADGRVAAEAQLELLEAAQVRAEQGSKSVRSALDAWESAMTAEGALARFRVSLHGGDAEAGRRSFFENTTAGCFRCHAIEGQPGVPSEVGPELSSIGLLRSRQHLLDSILSPSQAISPGYEAYDAQGRLIPVSAMLPNYAKDLSLREIRDLVAYLADLQQPKKLAVYVHSAGYEHAVARREDGEPCLVERQWQGWAEADPRFEVQLVRSGDWFAGPELHEVDAVFFYTTGDLPLSAEGREALQAYVQGGGGFVGAHCATDTFMDWTWYGEMVGGFFDGHPWNANSTVTLRVEDPAHSTCRHLDDRWEITDEIYQFRDPYSRKKQHVLLSLDPERTDMTVPGQKRTDGDYAVAWTKRQGQGKVFYTSLGHRADVWTDEDFRQHLVEGFLWAAK